jgi:hypothetical protein
MNSHIEMQIRNMLMFLDAFQQSCRMAAAEDDGIIDRTEAKQLKKIDSAVERFRSELESVK